MDGQIAEMLPAPTGSTPSWPLLLLVSVILGACTVLARPAWLPSWLAAPTVAGPAADGFGPPADEYSTPVPLPDPPIASATVPSAVHLPAQVYRCAVRGKSVSYSDEPECPGGEATPLAIAIRRPSPDEAGRDSSSP